MIQAVVEQSSGRIRLVLHTNATGIVHAAPPPKLPWKTIGVSLKTQGLLTNRDVHSYYKNIVHRALFTHNIKPVPTIGRACRFCKRCTERIGHLPFCAILKPIWDRFLTLVRHQHRDAQPTHRLLLLGATCVGPPRVAFLPPTRGVSEPATRSAAHRAQPGFVR